MSTTIKTTVFDRTGHKDHELKAMRDRRVCSIYQLLKDGMKTMDAIRMMVEKTKISEGYAMKIADEAGKLLSQDIERDADVLIALHSRRYDKIYQATKDLYKEWIKFPQEREDFAHNLFIINEYKTALQALRQKERLYNLHSADVKDLISQIYYDTDEKEDRVETLIEKHINFTALTIQDLVDITGILEKTMIIKEKKVGVRVPDGSVETINTTPPVDRIDEEKSLTIRSNPIVDYTIINKVTPKQAAKDLNDIREKLRLSIIRKVELTYQEADKGVRENKDKNLNVIE